MSGAETIIYAYNLYNNCNSDELHIIMRNALNVSRDESRSAADRWEAQLTINAVVDIVNRRGGF